MTFLGGSVAFLWAAVTTWTGRANNAWGASRVWNSGTSWESLYTSLVGSYNSLSASYTSLNGLYVASQAALAAMTSDRDTWQARANAAWGASGVWSSGTSYQTERTPASELSWRGTFSLPGLSSGGGTAAATFTTAANNLGASGSGSTTITVPRTGQYTIAAGFRGTNDTGNGETMSVSLLVNGGTVDTANTGIHVSSDFGGSLYYQALLSAGATIQIRFQTSFDAIHGDGKMAVVFQPTQANP